MLLYRYSRVGLQSCAIKGIFDNAGIGAPEGITDAINDLGHHDALIDRFRRALAEELPLYARDGGFIAAGYAPELDEFRALRDESRRLIAGLQSRYVEETSITTLKVKHNNVLGYFIEVPAKQADKILLDDGPFIHRQAKALAATLMEQNGTELRINAAHQKLFQRAPRATELKIAIAFLVGKENDAAAWTQYAHALLASNEFQFIE